ncbi:MAG: CcoQ/FixQ family Cbb3-type cytochrome c oxidase assembly chaperone [Proteobacteria bacterium]|nr:CcoQ/FixQ family Cbb3-type cytochrome c oxidase assembly chaperone [Pseudomonadota bacterium]
MDINDLRALFTVVTFAVFIAIVWWAYSGKRKQAFEEAALLPITDDEPVETAKPTADCRLNERKAS